MTTDVIHLVFASEEPRALCGVYVIGPEGLTEEAEDVPPVCDACFDALNARRKTSGADR